MICENHDSMGTTGSGQLRTLLPSPLQLHTNTCRNMGVVNNNTTKDTSLASPRYMPLEFLKMRNIEFSELLLFWPFR
jgi:hypothetical protein